ncbi:MAG: 4Fe-4S dicluster domain-containing protein [Rhodanobacteraceae bacterium]
MSTDASSQQPCIHCGDCARACPEALDPQALFFALVRDDLGVARGARLDACTECNRCVEACPSLIPLLDWFRWGKSGAREHARAADARKRFLARNARLAREREMRVGMRRGAPSPIAPATQTISRSEVLAAIARGKARRREKHP